SRPGLGRLRGVPHGPPNKTITDAYLLGMAVRHNGRLATFHKSIPVKAIVGARPAHLEWIATDRNRARALTPSST
ncbi:MAG: hypothetical protein ACR2I2_18050, partial [Bryobacteraceae bacterium]